MADRSPRRCDVAWVCGEAHSPNDRTGGEGSDAVNLLLKTHRQYSRHDCGGTVIVFTFRPLPRPISRFTVTIGIRRPDKCLLRARLSPDPAQTYKICCPRTLPPLCLSRYPAGPNSWWDWETACSSPTTFQQPTPCSWWPGCRWNSRPPRAPDSSYRGWTTSKRRTGACWQRVEKALRECVAVGLLGA